MAADFRWNAWNADHATQHGCTVEEIESVVKRSISQAHRRGHEKWLVRGRGQGDRVVQVVFLYDPDWTVRDPRDAVDHATMAAPQVTADRPENPWPNNAPYAHRSGRPSRR